MNKTAITVLIEEIELRLSKAEKSFNHAKKNSIYPNVIADTEGAACIAYENILKKAIALLPKEREDIEKAFMNGAGTVFGCTSYFDTNYLQYKP